MMNKLVLLIIIQMLFPSFLLAETVSVFRLGDHPTPQPQQILGHCTGFYIHGSGEIITAAHCNHFKDMKVISDQGKDLLELPNTEKYYVTSPNFGPLDVLVIKLNSEEESHLKALKELIYQPRTDELIIAGFPTLFRNQNLSLFKCTDFATDPSPFSKFWIEKELNSIHVQCPISNKALDPQTNLNFTHAQLAGLSGGPVFKNKKVIGVAYHYQQPDLNGSESFYKVQLFSASDHLVSEQNALTRFQLKQKIFEEIKIPNLIIHQLSSLLTLELQIPYQLHHTIKSIRWNSDTSIRILFDDLRHFDIEVHVLPVSLRKFLQTYYAPSADGANISDTNPSQL